jgi:DNA-binding NarL/FixJ family response regulator
MLVEQATEISQGGVEKQHLLSHPQRFSSVATSHRVTKASVTKRSSKPRARRKPSTVATPNGRSTRPSDPQRERQPERQRASQNQPADEETIRIVVVDDHPLFRHGLVQLLNSEQSFSVVGEASAAPEAMSVIRRLAPMLVIVDLGLKGPSGLELTKSLRVEFPKLPVLVLSMHDEPTYAVRSLRAGANGYVTKEEALSSVLVAVREVINGRTYLSPGMASDVIANVVLAKHEPGADPTSQLTDREIEILERIGKGEEVKTIAAALHLSPKTVETHRAHIKEKLKLANARQVARYAVQWVSARNL